MPLFFISPTSKKVFKKIKKIIRLPFYVFSCFEIVIMSDFGMVETDDGRTPKIGSSTNLSKTLIALGLWLVMMPLYLKEPKLMSMLFPHLFLNLREDLSALILPYKDYFMSCQLKKS